MRTKELETIARRRRLDLILIAEPANIRAFTGLVCDNAVLTLQPIPAACTSRTSSTSHASLYTDFRYIPMVHRLAPQLKVCDLKRLGAGVKARRIGFESSLPHARLLRMQKRFPRATFVDVSENLAFVRAVKTPEEIDGLRAAERLTCEIWEEAKTLFRAGMTEREMARVIRHLMIDRADGESFDTIVCVGKNAAECHHVPDDTVWNGREPVLVDMGVKLNGFCGDLTRNLVPRQSRLYRQVYALVSEANRAAIAAVRPGLTGRQLDKVARDVIRKGGFGRCFGHSLGHGVGYEIHEAPYASRRDTTVLKAGMLVTIEPGIYLEDNLGVRIEDLVLVTETGCEVLSSFSEK